MEEIINSSGKYGLINRLFPEIRYYFADNLKDYIENHKTVRQGRKGIIAPVLGTYPFSIKDDHFKELLRIAVKLHDLDEGYNKMLKWLGRETLPEGEHAVSFPRSILYSLCELKDIFGECTLETILGLEEIVKKKPPEIYCSLNKRNSMKNPLIYYSKEKNHHIILDFDNEYEIPIKSKLFSRKEINVGLAIPAV